MTTKYLVLTDVDAIQSYVFSSVRMAMMVGASQIVRVADVCMRDRASAMGAELAVASGGVGLFVFGEECNAERFARQAATHFTDVSVNGTLTTSDVTCFDDAAPEGSENGFSKKRDQALDSLERRKRLGCQTSESVGLGMAWVCTTCGAERAVEKLDRPRDESPWRVCRPCCQRFKNRKAGEKRQRDYYGPYKTCNGSPLKVDIDFDTLCEGGPWGLVAIDGDGLGDRLQTFDSPQAFRLFSGNLERVMHDAISIGLQTIYQLRPSGTAPAIVLFDGGDDILIACRGELALPFVHAFSEQMQSETNWDWANGPVGFSAGVAIIGKGFPFRTAHRIADGLLRTAKRAAHKPRSDGDEWIEGAVDYAIVTESFGEADEIVRERELADRRGSLSVQLTGRPYRLAIDKPRSLSRLRSACEILADFPSSRLTDLRNHLTRSAVTSAWELTSGDVRRLLDESITPFVKNWETRTCRSEEVKQQWRQAMAQLGGFNKENEFPQADLADAMNLWRNG